MTRGTWHVTDVSNACRTLLFDLAAGDWSDELCELFGVPRDALPDLVPNWGEIATHRPDSRSSGWSCRSPASPATSSPRCSGRPASTWATPSAPTAPARSSSPTPATTLERSDAGPALDRGLALPRRRADLRARGRDLRDRRGRAVAARRAADRRVRRRDGRRSPRPSPDSEGVVFVPALTGLGAPHWDPHARGLIIGITRGTTRAHVVRATLEAIAFEVRDVLETMPGELVLAAGRRRRVRQRPALPDPGRPGRRTGRATGDRRDHRARRGLPRRARHRRLVLHRRPARDLAARPPLRARRRPGRRRRRPRPLDRRRQPLQGLGGLR